MTDALAVELEGLGVRIERLATDPDAVGLPFTRFFRPLMFRFGWKPDLTTKAFEAALDAVAQATWQPLGPGMELAVDELAANVRQIERATVVNRRVLVSYASWLRRVYEVLVGLVDAADGGRAGPYRDRLAYLPPMTLQAASAIDDAAAAGLTGEHGAREPSMEGADPVRLLELQLDTVDALLAAARHEDGTLGRRRRLLQAARQTLLETSAALELDGPGVERRLEHIAAQVTRVNRLQAVGLRDDVGLVHQARTALSRGERDRLYAALTMLHQAAVARADGKVADLTHGAIERLTGRSVGAHEPAEVGASLDRSAREVFSEQVVRAVDLGYTRLRDEGAEVTGDAEFDRLMAETVQEYAAPGATRAALTCALAVDGCLDVGGAMAPVRVTEEVPVATMVQHPMPDLTLVQARTTQDLTTALISDPRRVVMDLAAGRLLTRRYLRMDVATRDKTVMQGEVRVYLLDGSGSMLGHRARMRDAILVAELATLARRLSNPDRNRRVVVYYRYFNHELGPVHRVDSVGGALQAIHDVTSTPRSGGTELQAAVLASMQQVRDENAQDPDLREAQIVLVTDGEAPVELDVIERARRQIRGVPLGISVVALGLENPALRVMVSRQRRKGDRAFYHFLADDFLRRAGRGDIDAGPPVHLPPVAPRSLDDAALAAELDGIVEELAEISRDRRGQAGGALVADHGEGVHRRFAGWFPEPVEPAKKPAHPPEDGTLEHDDLESAFVLLASLADAIESIGSTALERKRDALEMLETLLPHARLTPARYRELLRLYPSLLAAPLEAVHDAVREGFWRHMDA